MTTYNTGLIALANNHNYKPVPVDFHGYEGEGFRYFQERLESYLAINNVHDARNFLKSSTIKQLKLLEVNMLQQSLSKTMNWSLTT
ncbi:hypothetical protein G6F42_027701 [Rhizopus arrhizus]|nr:hypothetical protein G6F42_027701 [Rhizopus arrhizus]